MEFAVAGITASPMLPFGWAFFTSLVFATVGAAGGILAVVGHVSVLGLANANMMAGAGLGSLVGPYLSTFMKDRWLRAALAASLIYIGLGYTFGGNYPGWVSNRHAAVSMPVPVAS